MLFLLKFQITQAAGVHILFVILHWSWSFPLYQARAGRCSAVDALKVTEAFANEDNYTVWSDLSGSLSSVAVLLQYTDAYPHYKTYARKLFSTIAATVGWDPKPEEGRV